MIGKRALPVMTLLLASCSVDGGTWPQWRGPDRDNISRETGLLKEWPEGGPPLAWDVEGVGSGIAGVAVAGGRIFAMGFIEDIEYLTALEEGTGTRLWVSPIGSKIGFSDNPLMRWLKQRAPTVDGDRVYAFSGDGQLVCLDVREGRERWRRYYFLDLGGRRPSFGFCDYPLVDGEKLICVVGGLRPSMLALDKNSGELIWRSATPDAKSNDGFYGEWAATVVTVGGGIRQYVSMMRHGAFSFRALDGKILWSYDKLNTSFPYFRTPIVLGDLLLISNANGARTACLKLHPQEDGIAVEERYLNKKIRSTFALDSALVVGGFLYSASGNTISCFDAQTGDQAWSQAFQDKRLGAFTYAEGHLYLYGLDGIVTLAAVTPERLVLAGGFKWTDRSNAYGTTIPVIASGRLYLRDESRLSCFQLREGNPAGPRPNRILLAQPERSPAAGPRSEPHAEFVATPHDIVQRMLWAAKVRKEDTLYDLGSGDGRIVIAAARDYDARAIGFEIEADLVNFSRKRIELAGLQGLATIEQKDLYSADLSSATVVAVYLPEPFLEKLVPQFEKLKPGARIVSHQFKIPGFPPDQSLSAVSREDSNEHAIHVWTMPLRKEKR